MDARRILPSGGLGEFPGLCGLYSGPSPQESDGGPSQTGLARPPPWADCVLILRLDKHCPTTAPQPASGRITGNEQSLAQRAGYMVLSITSPYEDLGTRMFWAGAATCGEKPTDTPVPAAPPAFLPGGPEAGLRYRHEPDDDKAPPGTVSASLRATPTFLNKRVVEAETLSSKQKKHGFCRASVPRGTEEASVPAGRASDGAEMSP